MEPGGVVVIPRHRSRLSGRHTGGLRWAATFIALGIVVELPTLFWNHTVSFLLFLGPGTLLVGSGMVLYLWSVVTRSE